jgi:hypothetical protein
MKTLTLLATIASAICMIISLIQYDLSEAMAWSIVTAYNTKDLINLLK